MNNEKENKDDKKHPRTLKDHIAKFNKGRTTFRISDDLNHWKERGITTSQQLDDHLNVEAYTNIFKNQHGFNPSNVTAEGARKYFQQREAEEKQQQEKPKQVDDREQLRKDLSGKQEQQEPIQKQQPEKNIPGRGR